MFLDVFVDSLRNYPIGTLLILIAIINIFAMFIIVLPKGKVKDLKFIFYLCYSFSTLLWVISNAYFQSHFLFVYGEPMAKFMAISANITISFAIISFYGFTHLMRKSKKTLSKFSWIVVFFLIAVTLIFNLIPNLAVKGVTIFPELAHGAKFEIILSEWNFIYFLIGLIALLASFRNFILALKNAKDRIENMRLYYILFSICLMYSSLVFSNIIMPQFFQNYNFVWITPLLSIMHVVIIGYAVVVKRFLDIRLLISKILKLLVAFSTAITITIIFASITLRILPDIERLYLMSINLGLGILIFNKIYKLLKSHNFYNYFGATDAEYLRFIAKDLKNNNKVYKTVEECEKGIHSIFSERFKNLSPQIIIIDDNISKKYKKIISYFSKNKEALITEEVKFTEGQKSKVVPFLKELESLGGVCIPIFHASKGLMALFILGEKSYNHLYTREEILALEDIGAYLSFVLTGILYNSDLEMEVSKKTLKLKNRIIEIKSLLEKQSDFIAVTAHEFKTPLTIALFQMEDLLRKKGKGKGRSQITQDLEVIDDALDSLKSLTQKLFTVQQYDLKKVKLNKVKTDIKQYLKDVHFDFDFLMKEKNIQFKFINKVRGMEYLNIDKVQMKQVLQNVLTNAYKFTPEKGTVNMSLSKKDKMILICINDSGLGISNKIKKTIFDKFESKDTNRGIGLGLYISKKIVDLHKGKIWIEDSDLGGAKVNIELKAIN